MTLSVRAHVGKNNKQHRKKHFGDVNKETDARFWASTGYKPGAQLNMGDPSDKAMSKVWSDVHAHVLTEVRDGKMVRTIDDPSVSDHLDNAKKAYLAAVNHMIGAQQATDDAHLQAHLAAAKDANQIARDSCAAAAALQPPSVTQAILDQARAEVSATAPVDPANVPAISGEEPVTAPTEQPQPQAQEPNAPDPQMLAPENDPWDERYKPPMQADNPAPQTPTAPAPAPATPPHEKHGRHPKPSGGTAPDVPRPSPPPPPPGPPGWVDYTGQQPAYDPGAPKPPPQRPSGSPRGRALERQRQRQPQQASAGGGPSAGQVALGVGAVGLFFGMVAFFRR